MKNIYLQILDRQYNSPLVLATVTGASGSTPQKPGSSALFGKEGLICGTVGGGIVEGKVQKIANDSISTKESGHYYFNLANDISMSEEAICGGQIGVLLDANPVNHIGIFQQISRSLADQVAGVIITMVKGNEGSPVLIDRYWMSEVHTPAIPARFIEKIAPVVKSMISEDNSSGYRELELKGPDEEYKVRFFLEPVFPPEQLVIAGAGHIGRTLAHIGSLLDFDVTVIDDRPEYANYDNIPDAGHIVVKNIGEAVHELKKNKDTYVVIVTRGHKDDAEALKACIGSNLCYTGMIGSKKKIESMRINFLDKGWATQDQWSAIHAPVGLEIKSRTVEEIAVSIAAQLVLVRNTRK